jgi:hypothetical protein
MVAHKEPLNEDQKRIINALEKGPLGLNELYHDQLECRPCKETLRKYLIKLQKLNLIHVKKAERRGQKDSYESTEFATQLMADFKKLEAKWENLSVKIERLDAVKRTSSYNSVEASEILIFLIKTSHQLLTEGLTAYAGYTKEIREKLLTFSADKFEKFFGQEIKVLDDSDEMKRQFIDSWKISGILLSDLESKIACFNTWKAMNTANRQTYVSSIKRRVPGQTSFKLNSRK